MPVYDDYKFGNPWLPAPTVVENMAVTAVRDNLAALTTQIVLLAGGITVPAGRPITGVVFMSGATAAGTPTNWWFTITNALRVTQRSTADQLTTAWAANTPKAVNLSSVWTPANDTIVYVGIMVKATTVPTLAGMTFQNTAISSSLGVTTFAGNSSTAQTTPPADNTTLTAVTAGVNVPWCALY